MKIANIKQNVVIRAMQLECDNFDKVHDLVFGHIDMSNVSSVRCSYPIPEKVYGWGSHKPIYTGRVANPNEAGIEYSMLCGSCIKIGLGDWVVLFDSANGKAHIDVYDSYEFNYVFDFSGDSSDTYAFSFSLINDNNIQRIFTNPNDYRLFRHILDVYVKQLKNLGSKNVIHLKTSTIMEMCHMSDKTFRKSRNNLIDMGVIYESVNGYKVSFETLNKLISA